MTIRVFLADDHAVVRDGLRLLLEAQRDITVVGEAADGRETVAQSLQLHPDVVIMDIAMPELNGIEATHQIRQTCPSTQIIFLSMHSNAEHVFRALLAGARGYLLKEEAGMEVVKAIYAVHAGRRYLSQRITDVVIDDSVFRYKSAQTKSPLERLSSRERQILQLVAEGNSSAKIAANLNLSAKSVETYRSRLMRKLGVGDIPTLVKFAVQHGLTRLE